MWPGGEVPPPPVLVHDIAVHEDWIELLAGTEREVELPSDFYLRELFTERPARFDEAVAFVRQWGRASDPDYRDVPRGMAWWDTVVAPSLTGGDVGGLEQVRHEAGRRYGLDDWGAYSRLVHPAEVIERARIMRYLASHFIRWQDGDEPDDDAWDLFGHYLNAALSAFQPKIAVTGVDPSVSIPERTAFSVAALQLLNDIAVKTPLKHCGNERCPHGGVYTRQRGRSKYGQHRTSGTRYCSRECAKSQAAREHRWRAKQSGGTT